MTLPKRILCYSGVVLLLVLIALNAGANYATRNTVPRRVMARVAQAPNASVVTLGNSLVDAGFDQAAFERALNLPQGGSLNLSLGASTPVEQLLLLRYGLRHHLRPQVVVYGYYDLQLSTPVKLSGADLIGNSAMLYYVEPTYAQQFYEMSLHDRIQFDIARHVPMIVDRGAFWAKVERVRRAIAQQGMPSEATNRFGRAEDFSLLEISDVSQFQRQCDTAASADLISPVGEIMKQATAAGAKVVFVEMPMRPEHVRTYYQSKSWLRYREHVREILASNGVGYINASEWVGDDSLFADHLHLTSEGATQFSRKLGQALPAEHAPVRSLP